MATAATDSRKTRARKPSTKGQWLNRSVHTVTCYSGTVVKIRIPDLMLMLKNDTIPTRLRDIALQRADNERELSASDVEQPAPNEERMKAVKEGAELLFWLVSDMVLDPLITPEEVEQLPTDDRTMLMEIANRERDTDALGVSLGVEPLSRWETFRRFHKCSEDCESCEEVRREFSSVDPG
jgi:hypothetical protein